MQPRLIKAMTKGTAVHSSADLFAFSTRDLQFTTGSGMRWPGGNLWFQRVPAKGRTRDEALTIKNTQIAEELALPPVKIHCSILAEDAIKAAVDDYKARHGTAAATAQ